MGEGGYAYRIEHKTMTTTLLSSSSSLVSLRRACATSLTATRSPSPVESFAALGPWVRILLLSVGVVTLLWALVVRQLLLVVFVVAGPFATCCLLCVWLSIGRLSYFGRPGLFVVGVA